MISDKDLLDAIDSISASVQSLYPYIIKHKDNKKLLELYLAAIKSAEELHHSVDDIAEKYK